MVNDFKDEHTAMSNPPVSRRHGNGRPIVEGRHAQGANERPLVTRFFCNGDQFYPGRRVYVSRKRYPTLDRLLGDLSRMLAGAVNLPYGVRQIYRAEDGRGVESLDDVVCDEARNFVCAGFETFRPLQYGQKYAERWCVRKSATNSLEPRDIVFQKNAKSCVSLDAAETEDASAMAKSVDKNLDIWSGTPGRSKPKPSSPNRSEKVNRVGPGETVSFGRQPKVEETRAGSEAFKGVNWDDDHHRARRKVNCSEASLPTTRTDWPHRLQRTPELTQRSGKTLSSCGGLSKTGGTRKSLEIASTWRKTGVFRDSSRELHRSPKVLESRGNLPENIECLRDTQWRPPTANIPADSLKIAENSAHSRETPSSSRATPVSSREISVGSREILLDSRATTVSSREIPISSRETTVSSREIPVGSREILLGSRTTTVSSREIPISSRKIPIGSRTTTVTSRENHVSSNKTSTTAGEVRETAKICKHPAAVPLNSGGKPAASAKNKTEFSPSDFSLDHNGAFPQTSRPGELQVVPKLQLHAGKDQNETHQTKGSRNSNTETPEQSPTTANNLKSPDPEQLSSRKKGLKSRNRETPLKSKGSVDRRIVESGFLSERFQMGEVLGEGNFAVVKRCQARETGVEYAMKVISKLKVKGKEAKVENELLILRRCRHPNVVRLIESYETEAEIYIIMELVEGGDLFEAIRRRQSFPEDEASSMVKDMAKALHYLHRKDIIHRDVKPENLLIQHKNDGSVKRLKLADFGLAVVTTGPLFKLCGTPTYVAPEILSDIGYRSEVDMWSVGVILYILLSGYPPFRSSRRSDSELFDLIQLGHFAFASPQWDHISDGAQDLIRRLLEKTVRKRLRADEVLRHPWIRSGAKDSSPVPTE